MRILIGEPTEGTEAIALRRIYRAVESSEGLLLANFFVGTRQFDFVLILPNQTKLIELKSLAGPVTGGQNGNWSIRDFTGEYKEYVGLNPWRQANHQCTELSDAMSRYQRASLDRPAPLNGQFYREFETIACIYPSLHPDSKVDVTPHKAEVMGFDTLVASVASKQKKRSWSISDWEQFATQFLQMHAATLEEAINGRVHQARTSVNSYRRQVRDYYRYNLPPLPVGSGDLDRGERLIQRLAQPSHQLLVGPSGSCKSFHLRHLVHKLASDGDEIPIFVDLKGYDGGSFANLVRRSIAPFTSLNGGELVGDIRRCALRPVVMLDALNECPEQLRPQLLVNLQAFVREYEARLVIADHSETVLPPEIRPTRSLLITLPPSSEKSQIFAYYAGVSDSEALAHLSSTFTNAFDLKLAGGCHARGVRPESRWALYTRYVRDLIGDTYLVASAFLRSIAAEMTESLTMAISRQRFEKLAETFYQQENTSLSAIEQLLATRLILANDDYVSFEHELLLDFFKAQYLARKSDVASEVAAEFRRPRNQHLLELALGQSEDQLALYHFLGTASDAAPVKLAVRGHCGKLAQSVARAECLRFIALGKSELPALDVTLHCFARNDGRKGVASIEILNQKALTPYGALLCGVIAENLQDDQIQQAFLELLRDTDARFTEILRRAAVEAGVKERSAWSEALREYGGFMLYGEGTPFVCSGILSAIRYSRMMSRGELEPLPIVRSLLESVYRDEERNFTFFTLLIELGRDSTALELDELVDLVQKAWDTGNEWLRMEAVRVLTFLHSRASESGPARLTQMKELLQSFNTDNVLVSTEVVEALAGYDGFDPPVSVEAARAEMLDLIDGTDEPTQEQVEGAALVGTTWPRYRREAAYTAISKIFEDIFMGAYSEAYDGLVRSQKKTLLELAALSDRPTFFNDWIIWELLRVADVESLPVFHRFATDLDAATSCTQVVVSAYIASLNGYARFSENPPPRPTSANDDRLAWAVVGEILFWSFRGEDAKTESCWKSLREDFPCSFPDILCEINHARGRGNGQPVDLKTLNPEEVRCVLEAALTSRDSLTSLFHGGRPDRRTLEEVISSLGDIGTQSSITLLEPLADLPDIGGFAVKAIQSIRRRI